MAAPSRKLFEVFVSKIPWTSGSMELKEYFGQFGTVKKCFLPFNRDTGFHKGYCRISFMTEEAQNSALQKGPHVLDGTKIHVEKGQQTVMNTDQQGI